MSLQACIELLNSPTGKKLDRLAKQILLRKVLFGIVLPTIGIDHCMHEILIEILNQVDSNNNVS